MGEGESSRAILQKIANLEHRFEQEKEHQKKLQHQKVKVMLCYGDNKFELPLELRRSELTRAEVLGRIGMIPLKGEEKKFSIRFFNTPIFLQQIHEIQEGDRDSTLMIPCNQEEFEQFDLTQK
ncbi:hypothetical protein [Synechococcus sp. PCC 7336]|uniref:hypothetical protein n=1 Tax=Synechococcus sp. PCC 7336 TaxID=195250 RepID=UPI0003468E12|nr:hypothetical protein [Synechococcus sp. PCC 7336]